LPLASQATASRNPSRKWKLPLSTVSETSFICREKFGRRPLTGEQVRWGLENLDLDEARLKQLGFEDMLKSIKVSCADHEGARTARIQQWNGKTWDVISGWYTADETMTDPIVKEVSAKYASERKIVPRDLCVPKTSSGLI
jgi:branched-chain amino acid transport system substrate-binding protein